MIVPTLRLGLGLRFPGPGPSFASTAAIIAAGPVFTTNFLALSSLPTGFSLSRATTGNYFDASGVPQSAAINAARFDHNAATLAAKGFLNEEQRTNLLLQSTTFSASWSVANTSKTTDGTLTIDGVSLAQKITANNAASSTGGANFYNTTPIVITSGSTYSYSIRAKAAGSPYAAITVQDSSGVNNLTAIFDLSGTTDIAATQTLSQGSSALVAAYSKYLGNGWFRITLVGSITTAGTAYVEIGLAGAAAGNTIASTGEPLFTLGTQSVYFSDAQGELGSFPTSQIPTTTAAVTRSADIPSSSSPLTAYLAAGPSVWEFQDEATGTIARTAYAAGAFDWPVNKWYRSMGVYAAGTDTSSHMTVGSAY